MGGVHMETEQWQLSLRSYLKAYSAFRCLDREHRTYLLSRVGRRVMRRALKGVGQSSSGVLFGNDNSLLLAAVLQKIGKAQSMLRQYGQAIETLEEALRI